MSNEPARKSQEVREDPNAVEQVHLAAQKGDVATVTEIINQYMKQTNSTYIDLDRLFLDPNQNNCTLMHKAAKFNHTNVMEYLFKQGASVESVDTIGATPLFYACSGNAADAVTFLASHNATLNARDKYEFSPLKVALAEGNYEVAEMLLLFRADIHYKVASKGTTVLHLAVEENDKKRVDWLINHEASIMRTDRNGDTVLFSALAHPAMIIHICNVARSQGNQTLAKLLRTQNSFGETVIHALAANEGQYKTNVEALSIILSEIKNLGTLVSIGEMLHDKEKTRHQFSALHYAVKENNVPFMEYLLKNEETRKEVQLDLQNALGDTPLHLAIRKLNMDMIKLLIEYDKVERKSFKIQNQSKQTPMMLAVEMKLDVQRLFKDVELETFDLTKDREKWTLRELALEYLPNRENDIQLDYCFVDSSISDFDIEFLIEVSHDNGQRTGEYSPWRLCQGLENELVVNSTTVLSLFDGVTFCTENNFTLSETSSLQPGKCFKTQGLVPYSVNNVLTTLMTPKYRNTFDHNIQTTAQIDYIPNSKIKRYAMSITVDELPVAWPAANRDFVLCNSVIYEPDKKTYYIIRKSMNHSMAPKQKGTSRGLLFSGWILQYIDDSITQYTYVDLFNLSEKQGASNIKYWNTMGKKRTLRLHEQIMQALQQSKKESFPYPKHNFGVLDTLKLNASYVSKSN
jgi:ankyrin repeat protein